jgi:hypothetical protein
VDRPGPSVEPSCAECGAPTAGRACQDRLHGLLERAFTADAAYGLAVACYMLQHPARQSDRALQWAHFHLTVALRHGLTPDEARRTARARFDHHRERVASAAVQAVRGAIRWRMTIAQVDPAIGEGAPSLRRWAETVLADVEGAARSP